MFDRLLNVIQEPFEGLTLQQALVVAIGLIATILTTLIVIELFSLFRKYYDRRQREGARHLLDLTRSPAVVSTFLLGLLVTLKVLGWDQWIPGSSNWLTFPLALSLTWGVVRALDFVIGDKLLYERHGVRLPRLFRDLIIWLIYFAVILFLLTRIFDLRWTHLSALFATSAVLSVILGLALQDTLSNLFAGLALHFEGSFRLGDWIGVGDREGEVAGITWRSIKIRTFDGDYVIVPNSTISKNEMTNYSQPSRLHFQCLPIGVDYETPPAKMKRVCLEVLEQIEDVMKNPPPVISLKKYNDFSIDYDIRFWIRDYSQYRRIRDEIYSLLWYYFKREGIVIPFPIRTLHIPRPRRVDPSRCKQEMERLRRVDLFSVLDEAHLERLAENVRPMVYTRGETVIEQGKPNETFYIVRAGRLEASIRDASGKPCRVGALDRGDYFGEYSLFTGEPASASVRALEDVELAALDKSVFQELIETNPRIAEEIGRAIHLRSAERKAALDAEPVQEGAAAAQAKANSHAAERSFLGKMRRIFKF
jgi:small-conductance mechanosensitive channel/CRP-like cAMP-binding protein